MSNETPELPEPLLTAVREAARLMSQNSAGAARGGKWYEYRRDVVQHYSAVWSAMRAELERRIPRRTLRPANPTLYLGTPRGSVLLRVAVCDTDRPIDRELTWLKTTDALYVITAPEGVGDGLVVARATSNPHLVRQIER